MELKINEEAKDAISLLEGNGFHGYIVGGSVRDLLCSKTPQDWDITTDATPDKILACFLAYQTLTVGKKHGTITVLMPHISLEITTHRIDGTYTDGRRPDEVTYTTKLAEDLKRRDFTMNAMAYDIHGNLYDFYGGREDLAAKTIRCVGDAKTRFCEDALRILRGLRFAAQLDFRIEEKTESAIHAQKALLMHVSKERTEVEFQKLILSASAQKILTEYFDVFALILPRLFSIQTASNLQKVPCDYATRLAALVLHNPIKKENYQEFVLDSLRPLALSNALKREVCDLVWVCLSMRDIDKASLKRALKKIGDSVFKKYMAYQASVQKDGAENLIELYAEIVKNKECYTLKDLQISGRDLKPFITDGRKMGQILNQLLDWVIDHPRDNEKSILIEKAHEWMAK